MQFKTMREKTDQGILKFEKKIVGNHAFFFLEIIKQQ